MQYTVYISDTHVTLKQSQGHQICNEKVDPEQGDNHAKFERFCFDSVREKAMFKGFCLFVCLLFSNEEICQFSPLNIWQIKNTT